MGKSEQKRAALKELNFNGSVEIEMAKVITFPVDRANCEKENVTTLEGATAEIIIFPGIRFEHHGVSFAAVK